MTGCNGGFVRKRKNTETPRKHRPYRVVKAFAGTQTPTKVLKNHAHYCERLPIEADTTRWWLQKQNRWRNSDIAEKVRVYIDDSEDTKEVLIYPIFDDPTLLSVEHATDYYLGFDAVIYCMADGGYEPFTADGHSMQPEVKYLVKQLRRMRRK